MPMNSRRDFLSIAVNGSALAAATALLPRAASASGASEMIGSDSMEQSVSSGNKGHYKPPFRFGIGGVPLGNEFAVVTDKDAYATIRTAALQFSAAPDIAAALVVGASSEQQILADYTSMQTRIPAEFWAELKAQNLIEQNAPVPA